MSKIRYLSDGALRYIKSRLDNIEKKIDDVKNHNIQNTIYGNIIDIKSNKFIIKHDSNNDNDVAINIDSDIVNGHIIILLDDGDIYNNTIYCKNDIIYANGESIGQYVFKNSQLNIHIGFQYKNSYISINKKYDVDKITNINLLNGYFIDNNLKYHIINDNTNFDNFINAKVINIDDTDYVIRAIDKNTPTNKIVKIIPVNAPLNNCNLELFIDFIDSPSNKKIRIKDNNELNYIDIRA